MADTQLPRAGLVVVSQVLICEWCTGQLHHIASFSEPPRGETDYHLSPYERELFQCRSCGHVTNRHSLRVTDLYEEAYASATYEGRFEAEFERIMRLPRASSDNRQRVERVQAFAESNGLPRRGDLLDIGSGLSVFVAAMSEAGWRCDAVDPDARAAEHASHVGARKVHTGDFMRVHVEGAFDLVTFNKVLEHVEDPVGLLQRAKRNLRTEGIVYVEVPDGEGALLHPDGPEREEFFVEHLCAMSLASVALISRAAGYLTLVAERIREPSGKFTIWAGLKAVS